MKNILKVVIVLVFLCLPGEAHAPSAHSDTELHEKLNAGAAGPEIDVSPDD